MDFQACIWYGSLFTGFRFLGLFIEIYLWIRLFIIFCFPPFSPSLLLLLLGCVLYSLKVILIDNRFFFLQPIKCPFEWVFYCVKRMRLFSMFPFFSSLFGPFYNVSQMVFISLIFNWCVDLSLKIMNYHPTAPRKATCMSWLYYLIILLPLKTIATAFPQNQSLLVFTTHA